MTGCFVVFLVLCTCVFGAYVCCVRAYVCVEDMEDTYRPEEVLGV